MRRLKGTAGLIFAFERLYRCKSRSFMISEGHQVLALLPLFEFPGLLTTIEPSGPSLADSLNYREKQNINDVLQGELGIIARAASVKKIVLRAAHLSPANLPSRGSPFLTNYLSRGYLNSSFYLHRVLDLANLEKELWGQLRKGTKHLVNRAKKLNLSFARYDEKNITEELMRQFYRHCVNNLEVGGYTGALGDYETFNFRTELIRQGRAKLYVARVDNREVGYAFNLTYKGRAYYYSGARDLAYNDCDPNHFLQWQVILDLKQNRYEYYDLGMQAYPSLFHIPDAKLLNISKYKAGFGGENILVFEVEKYLSKINFLRTMVSRTLMAIRHNPVMFSLTTGAPEE
jgi:hypothetical protein